MDPGVCFASPIFDFWGIHAPVQSQLTGSDASNALSPSVALGSAPKMSPLFRCLGQLIESFLTFQTPRSNSSFRILTFRVSCRSSSSHQYALSIFLLSVWCIVHGLLVRSFLPPAWPLQAASFLRKIQPKFQTQAKNPQALRPLGTLALPAF